NVGILLYEMLTGRNPFAGEGLHSVVVSILEEAPRPIDDVPRALWDVIERALAKSPDERFESAPDLAAALRAAAGLPASPSYRPHAASGEHMVPPSRRSFHSAASSRRVAVSPPRWPLVAGAAGAALVAAVTSAALALLTTEEPRPARGYTPTTVPAQT